MDEGKLCADLDSAAAAAASEVLRAMTSLGAATKELLRLHSYCQKSTPRGEYLDRQHRDAAASALERIGGCELAAPYRCPRANIVFGALTAD
jgi:hypothetical protein